MTVALDKLSLAEYCAYVGQTDRLYELVNGKLQPMSLGTGRHGAISEFLTDCFKAEIRSRNLPWTAKDMKVGIQAPRQGRWDTSRIPDVTVLTQAQWASLAEKEAVITLDQSPPLLVVEVVSDSTRTTDYRAKRTEYAVLEINEYWLVDITEQKVIVFSLVDGFYDQAIFTGDMAIASPTFAELKLTAAQIFAVP